MPQGIPLPTPAPSQTDRVLSCQNCSRECWGPGGGVLCRIYQAPIERDHRHLILFVLTPGRLPKRLHPPGLHHPGGQRVSWSSSSRSCDLLDMFNTLSCGPLQGCGCGRWLPHLWQHTRPTQEMFSVQKGLPPLSVDPHAPYDMRPLPLGRVGLLVRSTI